MNPMTYFKNYPDPFYEDWRSEPVPGWGARPVMAGPKMVGVGETEGRREVQYWNDPVYWNPETVKEIDRYQRSTGYNWTPPRLFGREAEERQYEGEPSSLSTRAKALIVVGLIGAAAVGIVFSDELFGKREG